MCQVRKTAVLVECRRIIATVLGRCLGPRLSRCKVEERSLHAANVFSSDLCATTTMDRCFSFNRERKALPSPIANVGMGPVHNPLHMLWQRQHRPVARPRPRIRRKCRPLEVSEQ